MINWFDMPAEGLSNGGEFEIKELTATENKVYETPGEVYNKVTVNVEGGGGSSWETVFDGSVTTVLDQYGANSSLIDGVSQINANTIKVTFNGTEYTCEKNGDDYGAILSAGQDIDWSEYPFMISNYDEEVVIMTESAGTYTLKIEEPQGGGGGSSDFSTAEVTIINTNEGVARTMYGACALDDGEDTGSVGTIAMPINTTEIFHAILYKGVAWITKGDSTIVSVSGSAEKLGSSMVMVTGDCTITIS